MIGIPEFIIWTIVGSAAILCATMLAKDKKIWTAVHLYIIGIFWLSIAVKCY